MAEGEDVLYESLDSHSSDEDIDEYITISTPLPYLCPEVPHKTTPTHSAQPEVRSDTVSAASLSPKVGPKLRPPIQEGQANRKHYRPVPAPPPYSGKAQNPQLPKKMRASPVSPLQSPGSSRPPVADYHRLEDEKKPPPKLPKPPRLPKPRFSKKKTNVRYVPKPEAIPPVGTSQARQDEEDRQSEQNNIDEEDDVYYDKVLSRTKWRNILKRKKMKVASSQPVKSSSVQENSPNDFSMSTQSNTSVSKKELEYSDDELKLRAGNPRVITILLTTIIIALVVAIAALAVSLVSISSFRKLNQKVKDLNGINASVAAPKQCNMSTTSSQNWRVLPSDNTAFEASVFSSMENNVSVAFWSCDITTSTSTSSTKDLFMYSSYWIITDSEEHNRMCHCICYSNNDSSTQKPIGTKCELRTTICSSS